MIEGVTSNRLLLRLRDAMAEAKEGQERLNRITELITSSLGVEVCSIYLIRQDGGIELYATQGLEARAVHQTVMLEGEGLVGRVAREAKPVNTSDAQSTRGFSYRPETGEDIYHGFLGVPIHRLGQVMGVLVVQSTEKRAFSDNEIAALEVVAIVLAEMTELGAFIEADKSGQLIGRHNRPQSYKGEIAQEGYAAGTVVMHNPRIQIERPVADDPEKELERIEDAFEVLDREIAALQLPEQRLDAETREILSVFESFSKDKGFRRRLRTDVESGLSAEAAVEIEQTRIRSRMSKIKDSYIRERMADFDDLSNRLLRILAGVKQLGKDELPPETVLIARNLGPAEIIEYGRAIKGIVLSEGSVGSHAAIVARAWAIPLIVHAKDILFNARTGDHVLIDGETGDVHLRPDDAVISAFNDKMQMSKKAQAAFSSLADKEAITKDGVKIDLMMNAGLIADLPSLVPSGAEGVGLFRTELQFLTQPQVPKRDQLTAMYERVLKAAGDKPVIFRTLDIGSDKVLPYMEKYDEPNPAMGWRAIRVGLDRPNVLKMQVHGLLRAVNGGTLNIMFPFIAQLEEFVRAREIVYSTLELHKKFGYAEPKHIHIGAMLETPSLAFAPGYLFDQVDFISVGGNDLKQFFFAADRENERVRRRYDTLNTSFLRFLQHIVGRAEAHKTRLSFCGEDAGRPLEALAFMAMGFRTLSMRPASIGLVKYLVRQVDLGKLRTALEASMESGQQSVRDDLLRHLRENDVRIFPVIE